MEYLGSVKDYQAYRNNDGFIELYKKVGKGISIQSDQFNGSDCKRIITNQKTLGGQRNI